MLITQFLLENLHFAINLFAALVFFAVCWLYLDAWLETKEHKELFKIIGFGLFSLAFLIHATYIEQSVLASAVYSVALVEGLANLVKLAAFIFLIIGLVIDPIQAKPIYKDQESINNNQPEVQGQPQPQSQSVAAAAGATGGGFSIQGLSTIAWAVCFPVLSLMAFLLYLRRATIGLENHLKPVAFGFFFIFLYEVFSITRIFENTTAISIYNIVRPFGPLWIVAHIFLFVGVTIIGKWVFNYLLKRLQTEIFMIFNISVLVIFLITTVVFTGLLLTNLRSSALIHLTTDANVVQYAIASKQEQALSDAEMVSQNPQLQTAIAAGDRKTLKTISTATLLAKKQSFLIIVASSGAVLMRGEDNDKIGDSLSSDSLFKRAMRGEKASSVATKDGPIAPVVSIRSAVPITASTSQIIGVVIVGSDIDNAFVDGLKTTTKLDVSVYAGNELSATTFIANDGKSRYIGVKEKDNNINKIVLIDGKNYSGEVNILSVPYFAAFTPLKDVNGNPVGMLFAGQQQVSIIQAASSSIEYTFIIAVLFLFISVLPSYLISRFITNQFK
jgi:hypothetical protein